MTEQTLTPMTVWFGSTPKAKARFRPRRPGRGERQGGVRRLGSHAVSYVWRSSRG